jgi:putative membrane protein
MFRLAAFLGLAGLAIATTVIVWSGWSQVALALADAGWGIALVGLYHLTVVFVSGAGWRVLLPAKRAPSLWAFVHVMWVRAAVNNLMPVARIGGEIVAVRLLSARGITRTTAVAVTVVELTLSVLAMFLFVVAGVAAFALHVGGGDTTRHLFIGLAATVPVLVAFIAVQRIGFFGLLSRVFRTLFRDKWAETIGDINRLDRTVNVMYRRHGRVFMCGAMQLVGWIMGFAEIWMATRFVGHPLPVAESFMLEALVQGSASAAFAVPGALGVQEAGFILFGGTLGLPREIAAALAVIRRCRDLLCYAPALVWWQAQEGRRLLHK